jgi:hypothetical protein
MNRPNPLNHKNQKLSSLHKKILKPLTLQTYNKLTTVKPLLNKNANYAATKNIKTPPLTIPKQYMNNLLCTTKLNFEKSSLLYKSTILKSRTRKPFTFRNSGIFL